MKRFLTCALSLSLIASAVSGASAQETDKKTETVSYTYSAGEGKTYTREMEKLNRGLVAVKSGSGVYLSWRLFDSEDTRFGSAESNVSFKVYRDGSEIAAVTDSTNYTDTTVGTSYSVAPVVDGVEGEKCGEVSVNSNSYFDIPLTKPANMTLADGNTYSYTINDVSCGDLDGDGDYEFIVKWDCNGKDNSQSGYTGNVLLDAYDMETGFLWRVDLGQNIRAGAHYTQFLVYDFDGDGRAEMTCKTAPGSKDSQGNYVTAASADTAINSLSDEDNGISYVDDGGRVSNGDEYYTLFDENGIAVDTIYYPYLRNTGVWGYDSGGNLDNWNRIDRYLGAVAYLDGEKPAAVTVRGYYDRTTVAAYTVENNRLQLAASFEAKSGAKYSGQGNHNMTVADVDNDGKDEVITGAICWDDDLSVLWCSGRGHGDALHIGDYDPTHPGLEYFSVHESGGYTITSSTTSSQGKTADYGMTVYDAATGEELCHYGASGDTGRGVMANIGSGGYYQITGSGTYQSNGGTNFTASSGDPGNNFRIFWDGDLYDEILDGTSISSADKAFTATGCTSINSTKANPALQADLFGDWREEVVYPTTDNTKLRVFMTTTPTEYKIKTLMQDPVYRSGVAAEQTAYNQPPHVGLYLNEDLFGADVTEIKIKSAPAKTVYTQGESLNTSGLVVEAYYDDGTNKEITAYSISGYDPSVTGEQTVTVTYMDKTAEFKVTVKEIASIVIVSEPTNKTAYQNGTVNTAGLVVKAVYGDGSSAAVTDYTLSYNLSKVGEQTVTVTYMGKTAEFKITVKAPSIEALNREYVTNSADSVLTSVPIGSFSGNFTIEHTVTINSMPANGSADKSSTAGFFLRFMNTGANHTGGGWYLTASGSQAQVAWKNTQMTNIGKIDIGKTYTFKYEFTNVGSGTGAALKLSIIDSDGNTVASQSGLNVRNFSDTNTGKLAAITDVEVYNQAKSGSTADVTIDNAVVYGSGDIVSVDGYDITLNLETLAGMKLYAAQYNNGALSELEELYPEQLGESLVTANIAPDKVFLWTAGMRPVDVWEREIKTGFNVTVTAADAEGTPLSGAEVTLSELKPSSGGDGAGGDSSSGSYGSGSSTDGEVEPMSLEAVTLTTGADGKAVFENIPVGRYRVVVKYADWSNKVTNITVSDSDAESTINFAETLTAG